MKKALLSIMMVAALAIGLVSLTPHRAHASQMSTCSANVTGVSPSYQATDFRNTTAYISITISNPCDVSVVNVSWGDGSASTYYEQHNVTSFIASRDYFDNDPYNAGYQGFVGTYGFTVAVTNGGGCC